MDLEGGPGGWNRRVEVGKEKDHLVTSGWPSVPSKHEECDYGQVSTTRGDPHWFVHDLVEVKPDIGDPARYRRWEQEYQSVPSMRSPKCAEGVDQREDKTEKEFLQRAPCFMAGMVNFDSPKFVGS